MGSLRSEHSFLSVRCAARRIGAGTLRDSVEHMLTQRMQLMHFVGTVRICLPFIAPAGQYFSQIPQPMHSLEAMGYSGSAALFFLA